MYGGVAPASAAFVLLIMPDELPLGDGDPNMAAACRFFFRLHMQNAKIPAATNIAIMPTAMPTAAPVPSPPPWLEIVPCSDDEGTPGVGVTVTVRTVPLSVTVSTEGVLGVVIVD